MRTFKRGDHVTWKSHGGTAEGHVVRKLEEPTEIKGHHVAASPEHPEYLVESDSGHGRAAHKPGALKKA